MTETARTEFARALLDEASPAEAEFFEAYEVATSGFERNRRAGTGMGLPPEVAGALGVVAVLVSHAVFDKLAQWAGDITGAIAKKFIVDAAVGKLKFWLLSPKTKGLAGVLTPQGRVEILGIVERDAKSADLSAEDTQKLLISTIEQLGI